MIPSISEIDALPNEHGITTADLTLPFAAICEITGDPFVGEVTFEYHPCERMPEYGSVERAVAAPSKCRTTQEGLTRRLHDSFERAVAPHYLLTRTRVFPHRHAEATVEIESEA